MKVTVDESKCIGCGVCADIAESVLELNEGKSKPITGADISSPEVVESVKMAVECCPVQSIIISE